MSQRVLVVPHNHLDPTWRRCFDRKAIYNELTIASYYQIEEKLINSFISLSDQNYVYSDGQTAIWRKYLEKNPDKKSKIKDLVKKGLCELHLSGETIQDTNLPTAEGLVRNFLVAKPLYDELCGDDHPGQKLGWTYDAFGNSSNYPQVLKGVGAEVACMTTYKPCLEDIWVGIDGTKLPCYDSHPCIRTGFYEKQPPCYDCKGKGCSICDHLGFITRPGFDMDTLAKSLEEAVAFDGEWVAVFITVEEHMAESRLPAMIKDFNKKYSGRCHFKIANPNEIYAEYKPVLDKALSVRDDTPTPDLNPAMTGCYVSRIKTKQRTRSLAYRVIQVEAELARSQWADGHSNSTPADFSKIWQLICFNQFHDAITGTHIDNAYVELMDMLDESEALIRKYEKCSLQKTQGPIKKITNSIIQLGAYELEVDQSGIISLKVDGEDVMGKNPKRHPSFPRPFRIGELLLEADFGDAWGTRMPPFKPTPDRSHSIPLGMYNDHFKIQTDKVVWRGKYNGGDPMVKTLEWETTLSFDQKNGLLDFKVKLNWDTNSKRLKAFFPVDSEEFFATWEVPYGHLDRTYNESEISYSQWRGNDMNFPALHWVHKETQKNKGVAVFNEGLPCYRWYPGQIDLSLVRSPQWAFCSVEVANYEFWDIDGKRDTGLHEFHFGLLVHAQETSNAELTRIGYDFNQATIELPFKIDGNCIVTAFKPAECGKGWVLRAQESNGENSLVEIDFKKKVNLSKTNLLEEVKEDLGVNQTLHYNLHKFEICTFLIELAE